MTGDEKLVKALGAHVERLLDERDRLVAECDGAHALTEKALANAHRSAVRAEAAEAERDRLREALRAMVEIAEETDPYPTSDGHPLYAAREVLFGDRGQRA